MKSSSCYQYEMAIVSPILQIRNRRVSELATRVAFLRQSTKTDAVLAALEHELDRLEAVVGRRGEAVEKRPFGEHQGEIGGE